MTSGPIERRERKSVTKPPDAVVTQALDTLRRALLAMRVCERVLADPNLRELERPSALKKHRESVAAVVRSRAELDVVLIGDDV